MSIQPVVGLPGVYPPKLSVRREIFLHPDRVSYRYSGRFLHKYARDWENPLSPNTLKAGTLLALRRLRFPGEPARLYWFPAVLTINHTSDTNKIILPAAFRNYSYMFGANCRFTRVRLDVNHVLQFHTVIATGVNVTDSGVVEITVDPANGVNNTWANHSILLYSGLEGPVATISPLDYYVSFSVLPSDTLLGDDDIQLHHYPWSGIVRGDMLYPRRPAGHETSRNVVQRRFLKAATASGLSSLLVDEALVVEE